MSVLALRRPRFARRLRLRLPPPALLALSYAGLVALGSGALMLPAAQAQPFGWGDALFTATSAVTVTGLMLFDAGTYLTTFGQAVVMVLMQLGGLGLMTFAVAILSALGLPMGLPSQIVLKEDLNQTSLRGLNELVWVVVKVVLAVEALGALLLATVFVPDLGWGPGLWSAAFHSVSAFNNAGVQLYPDGLARWVGDPVVNLTVPALFILGGLGYSVVWEVAVKRRWRLYSFHTKLMLAGTAALILWAVPVFALLEWTNPHTLGPLDVQTKLMASWFQGVSPRTAGFNTLDIASLHDSTALMVMSLMLIGAGSASTGGGIKVTTFIVLILATVAFFKRRTALHAFGRSLGLEEVFKVMALTTISMLVVGFGSFAVMVSHDGEFLDIAFEVCSAFGTVGLSRGETAELDGLGRTVVMALMFIGRVGPLTLGFFLATRSRPRVAYPSARVYLG
jgi:trk system potassium uptake protein TrkH